MKDLLASIYELGIGLYGQSLGDHLYGLDPRNTGEFTATAGYSVCFMIMFILVLSANLLFYKFIDSPRSNGWVKWLIWNIIIALINGLFAFMYLFKDFQTRNFADDIKDKISITDIIGFTSVHTILSLVVFMILSILVRRFSINNRLTPFGGRFI